ncbi:hypothetical protein N0V93_008845 [Gnomoniopsis smithogilvyi]|uniref:ATP-dependent RNA helicase n=1 Tax=Gnomoniopsis smithogilvyi TaxID=1191159 RepID=A0A9W8YPX1_9PEZI|nr:hypothetical protein N0V93_008845 [Gnomoniopsis smithogilvyi]
MSGTAQNNNMNGGDGSSRKRQYPFKNRNRGGRRGAPNAPAQSTATASSAFSTSAPSPASAPPSVNPDPTAARFDELARFKIDRRLLDTVLVDMKMATMTPVQAETLPHTLTGSDVLAQAKTGTGKTIAFLLPAIQKLISNSARNATPRNGRPVSLLVISPTRELATQIGDEAKRLLQRFPNHNQVHIAVGGTNPKTALPRILSACDILVATPGRLLDYLGQPDGALRHKLQGLQTLVLDEADRLMDMGFLPDIRKVVSYLPAQASTGRTGMLFSATINDRVKQFAGLVLSDQYKFVSTIPAGEAQTHEHVPQCLIAVPTFADLAPALVGALRHEIAAVGNDTFKTIIFAPTAAQVDFYAEVLAHFPDLPSVVSLHSRISQSKRTATTERFRTAKSGILVATDVVARGLDFPGVTNVFQVGLPSEKEAYIHRLGRTARAGAEGRGTLVLASSEPEFARKTLSMIKFVDTTPDLVAQAEVQRIVKDMDPEKQAKTYRAWLGYYKTHMKLLGWTPAELVRQANTYARDGLGAISVPTVETRFVGKTGLKGVPGLNIVKTVPR